MDVKPVESTEGYGFKRVNFEFSVSEERNPEGMTGLSIGRVIEGMR